MIYTITLNPSIDYLISIDNLKLGEVNRSQNSILFPGGKGINVSRVLTNGHTENIALGFVGGFTGTFIQESLQTLNIKSDFNFINGLTRINVKIKSTDETDINGEGPSISNEELKSFFQKLKTLKEGDILVMAGKIQNTLPQTLYSDIQNFLKDSKVKIIVDTSGDALLQCINNKPFLIKPNNFEIEEIFKTKITSREELIQYGEKLHLLGAENVIISLAGAGALLINKDGVFFGNAPKGKVINSVGAGDSLVGGFLNEYSKSQNILESFKRGIATGSASAFSLDICTEDFANTLLSTISITKLSTN